MKIIAYPIDFALFDVRSELQSNVTLLFKHSA